MADQVLLRLYHQSQGVHKGSKKAAEELHQHLNTASLPVSTFDLLLQHVFRHVELANEAHQAPTRWLTELLASNLLRTAQVLPLFPPPTQQNILLKALPEALERWFKLTTQDKDAGSSGELRNGVFVPSSVLQGEILAQKNESTYAFTVFLDTIGALVEMTDNEDTVALVTRIVQVIVANGRATALQKIFVRFADVLIGWTT
ncbi:hypothetical protein THRCLA_11860, partial [Thraustotheca clavata]